MFLFLVCLCLRVAVTTDLIQTALNRRRKQNPHPQQLNQNRQRAEAALQHVQRPRSVERRANDDSAAVSARFRLNSSPYDLVGCFGLFFSLLFDERHSSYLHARAAHAAPAGRIFARKQRWLAW